MLCDPLVVSSRPVWCVHLLFSSSLFKLIAVVMPEPIVRGISWEWPASLQDDILYSGLPSLLPDVDATGPARPLEVGRAALALPVSEARRLGVPSAARRPAPLAADRRVDEHLFHLVLLVVLRGRPERRRRLVLLDALL
mmetsp:Transcript_606/g.2382  ORF Transcript_606/g.2382 Transcript_606/m.2382 type:complete len:139 (-) Transcript_606:197-613(-)